MRASTSDDHDRTGSGEGYGLPHKASLDEGASKFKKLTSLGSMGLGKASDGSLRGLFHRGTTSTEKSLNAAPGAVGAQYLREEIKAAREAVNGLDKAVSNAASFREKATKLLEEAHRALGRLEQAVGSREYTPDFITIACEVKCAARRGITLVDVYGKYSTLVKIMTFVMRSYIYGKFDKQINNLKGLLPASDLTRGAAASSHPASVLSHPLASIADSTYSALPQASGSTPSVASPLAVANSVTPPGAGTPSGQALPQPAGSSQALARSSLGNPLAAQPQASGPGPLVGIMLRNNKHDRVYAMAFVPPGQSPSEHVCVWWSAGSMLEYYSEATQATTGFQMEKASMHVTALGVDDDGNVWTGHAKGLVRVRTRQQWEYTVEDKAFTGAVKAIAFDEWGRAWVGDETGRIKVLGYDPRAGRLESVATLQRSAAVLAKMKGQPAGGAAGLFGKRHCSGTAGQPSAAAVYAMATNAAGSAAAAAAAAGGAAAGAVAAAVVAGRDVVAGPSAVKEGNGNGASTPPAGAGQVAIEGPVRCIFSRGGRAWTSGGRQGWLQLWDVSTFQDLDVYDCCAFGPCHTMAPLRWPTPTPSAGPSHIHRRTGSDGGRMLDPTSSVPTPLAGGSQAQSSSLHAPAATSWRLLTGHENGQLLLWHPNFNVLAPLLRIGEPCSPCRGIASFDSCRLVATGHQNGEMHLFVQPSNEGGLPPGSNSASPQSFGTLRPRMVTIQAHKSRLDRMSVSGTSCLTASQLGTIRLWHADSLVLEAQRQGLLTHTSSYGSLGVSQQGSGTTSTAPSMYPGFALGASARYASTGDLPSGASPGVHRDSAKRLGSVTELPSQHSAAQAMLGSQAMSTALSSTVSAQAVGLSAANSGAQALGRNSLGVPSGGTGHLYHHGRTGSRESVEAIPGLGLAGPGGTLTQASSGNTATTELSQTAMSLTLGAGQGQGLPAAAAASLSHFQTIEASELSMKKLIGSGAYGKVWLAEWTGVQVAVKELYSTGGAQSSGNEKNYAALMNEVTLLGSLSHPNIMRFLAMCMDPPLIVMQYYPHGSLFDLLSRAVRGSVKAAKELSWGKRLDMLRDVAAGMTYLHSRKPPVIHGDLRSPNLLLDLTIDHDRPRFHVKIADFGLARATGAGTVMVSKTTNPRWLAPEVIKNSSLGKAADVYSFAIIMWEMLTWQQPYEDMMSIQVMFSTVSENSRPEVPAEADLPGNPGVTLGQYRQLMEVCWHADAAVRPTFKEVVERFQAMQQVEADNARQLRAAQQAAGGAGTGHSRHVSETGDRFVTTTGGEGGTRTAPGSGGSGSGGPTAPRRQSGLAGVASPFSGAPAAAAANAATTPEPHGYAIPGPQSVGATVYGTGMPPFGMSPILEEQMSYGGTGGSPGAGPVAAAAAALNAAEAAIAAAHAGASSPFAGHAVATSSPFGAGAAQHPSHAGAAAAMYQHVHHHHNVSQPHVHFAPTTEVAHASASSPPSPAMAAHGAAAERGHHHAYGHSRAGGGGSGRPSAPSSNSSTDSAAVAMALSNATNATAISGASVYSEGGGLSTASSRHSSTSQSGKTLGAAAAAAVAANAAAAGAGGHGAGASNRRPGSSSGRAALTPAPTRTRRNVSAASGASPRTSPTGDAAVGRSGQPPVWAHSTHVEHSSSTVSPFAAGPAPSDDLEGFPSPVHTHSVTSVAVASGHAAHGGPAQTVSAPVGMAANMATPFGAAMAGVQHAGAPPRSGVPAASGRSITSNSRPSSGVGVPANARARLPGPSFGPAPPRGLNAINTSRTSAHSHSSQPGTPPYRSTPSGSQPRVTALDGRSSAGSRLGSVQATAATGRSVSGDGPSSTGSRTPTGIVSRTPSITSATSGGPQPGGGAVAVTPGTAHLPVAPRGLLRQSQSAVHPHIAYEPSHGGAGAEGGGGGATRPTHRRTPSGGGVSASSHTAAHGSHATTHAHSERSSARGGAVVHPHNPWVPATHTATSSHGGSTSIIAHAGSPGSAAHSRTSGPGAVGRTGRSSPHGEGPGSASAGRGTRTVRRNVSNLGPGGSTGSPGGTPLGIASRLSAAAAARASGSPRMLVAGGVGSTSAHAHTGDSGRFAEAAAEAVGSPRSGQHSYSRIPSFAHGVAPASGVPGSPARSGTGLSRTSGSIGRSSMPLPGKSSNSLSLDEANLRRLGLGKTPSGSSRLGVESLDGTSPAGPSPAGYAGGNASGGGPTSPGGGGGSIMSDEALSVGMSPQGTVPELPADALRSSTEFARLRASAHGAEASGRVGSVGAVAVSPQQAAVATGAPASPPMLSRIATRPPVAPHTGAAWVPPPLLSNLAVGGTGSPFAAAAAAHRSPFAQDEPGPPVSVPPANRSPFAAAPHEQAPPPPSLALNRSPFAAGNEQPPPVPPLPAPADATYRSSFAIEDPPHPAGPPPAAGVAYRSPFANDAAAGPDVVALPAPPSRAPPRSPFANEVPPPAPTGAAGRYRSPFANDSDDPSVTGPVDLEAEDSRPTPTAVAPAGAASTSDGRYSSMGTGNALNTGSNTATGTDTAGSRSNPSSRPHSARPSSRVADAAAAAAWAAGFGSVAPLHDSRTPSGSTSASVTVSQVVPARGAYPSSIGSGQGEAGSPMPPATAAGATVRSAGADSRATSGTRSPFAGVTATHDGWWYDHSHDD